MVFITGEEAQHSYFKLVIIIIIIIIIIIWTWSTKWVQITDVWNL